MIFSFDFFVFNFLNIRVEKMRWFYLWT